MENKTLSSKLKTVIILLAVLGIGLFAGAVPVALSLFVVAYPDFGEFFIPWLIFLSLASVPLFAILGLGFSVANEIAQDNSFSLKNAKRLKSVAMCLLAEAAYFFTGNLVLWFCNLNYPAVVLLSLALCLFAVGVAVAVNVLAQLVKKAVTLREDNEAII